MKHFCDVRLIANKSTCSLQRPESHMKTNVSTKGQFVLPAAFRRLDNIEPGQEFEIERIDCGEYRLTRLKYPSNEGLVDWLAACPEKGYFVPIATGVFPS